MSHTTESTQAAGAFYASCSRPVQEPAASVTFLERNELPVQPEAGSQTLIIKQTNPLWVPTSPRSIPGAATIPLPLYLAREMALKLNAITIADPQRRSLWHVVVSTGGGRGYVVIQITRDVSWTPTDATDVPPDASEPVFNVPARTAVVEFNKREMQRSPSPPFWALNIKPLKIEAPEESAAAKPTPRKIRLAGRDDVFFVVNGCWRDAEAMDKLKEAIGSLTHC